MATPRLRTRKLSEPTIARLPVYQRIAESWDARGLNRIDSQQIGELVLLPAVRNQPESTIIAAPGTSCRHQIKDGTGRKALHPIEVLYQALVS